MLSPAKYFRTPKNLNWNGSARQATHALTEFTGLDPDNFSFDITLTAKLGVNPMEEMVKIWNFERDAEALGLVIGGKAYGKYRWTIKDHKTKIEHTEKAGDMYAKEVPVELLEYLKGEFHNTTKKQPQPAPASTGDGGRAGGSSYTVKKGATSGISQRSITGTAHSGRKSTTPTGM